MNNNIIRLLRFFPIILIAIYGCGTFVYKTYDRSLEENTDDPEPNYKLTLNEDFQNYTNFLYPGNRVENFVTFFNTFYNAKQDFNDAYEEYLQRSLEHYSDNLDSAVISPQLSQEAKDKFNKAIQNCSKVIQLHKSSDLLDDAVLLIGKAYFYLGDNLKAERKFGEFISKLNSSPKFDEALLFLSKSQIRLNNNLSSVSRLENLIKTTGDEYIKTESYRSLAEYYLGKKEYDKAIENYKSSIRYSNDNDFKAQMQYIIATITANSDNKKAITEFQKVLDFSPEYQLEYLTLYNYTKALILANNYSAAQRSIENMRIKYKDDPNLIPDIELLEARNKLQEQDFFGALNSFKKVISEYKQTVASSDAAYYIAQYYEIDKNDYLNAYRFYRLSAEQNGSGRHAYTTNQKVAVYKRYYELKSSITEKAINTDYDSVITNLIKTTNAGTEPIPGFDKGLNKGEKGEGEGKSGWLDETDSNLIKAQNKANQMFELAEIFQYDLKRIDSAEYYLQQSFDISQDNDFKSKVLFALANLYTSEGMSAKSEEVLHKIIELYPNSVTANESRKLLRIPVSEDVTDDMDTIYKNAQDHFIKGDYDLSMAGFSSIINNNPGSKNIERAYYAIGWIYENVYFKPDSAYFYYNKLMELNPMSKFGPLVGEKILEYRDNQTGNTNKENESIEQKQNEIVKPDENIIKQKEQELPPKIDNTSETPVKKEQEKQDNSDGNETIPAPKK